jgi:hypothetical protein
VSGVCKFDFVSNAAERLNGIDNNRISQENEHRETSNVVVVIKYRLVLIIMTDRLHCVFNVSSDGTVWSIGNTLFVFGRWSVQIWVLTPAHSSVPPSTIGLGPLPSRPFKFIVHLPPHHSKPYRFDTE